MISVASRVPLHSNDLVLNKILFSRSFQFVIHPHLGHPWQLETVDCNQLFWMASHWLRCGNLKKLSHLFRVLRRRIRLDMLALKLPQTDLFKTFTAHLLLMFTEVYNARGMVIANSYCEVFNKRQQNYCDISCSKLYLGYLMYPQVWWIALDTVITAVRVPLVQFQQRRLPQLQIAWSMGAHFLPLPPIISTLPSQ